MTITVGELFAGIGGMSLGLERSGMRTRWFVENDPYCRRVLAKHWPDVHCYGDIKAVDFSEVEPVDVICGGFPCQPVSVAGKRRAQQDERWLWPHMARAISMVRPRFVLVENVPGLLSAGMGDVLGDLAGMGFDAEWASVRAADVGAPHLRQRVFVVGYQPGARPVADPFGFGRATWRETGHLAGAAGASEGVGEQRQWGGDAADHRRTTLANRGWWATEPDVDRVAHGIPRRMDRLRALGNAVVPQVAEWVGRLIVEAAA